VIRALTIVITVGVDAGEESVLQFRDTVAVGADGNGILSAEFPTTVSGPNVRYVLAIENGRADPPPVNGLTVTLNEDIVFQNDDEFSEEHAEVALNGVGLDDNRIVLAARGAAGSSARVRVLAVRDTGSCTPCHGTTEEAPTAHISMRF
jgi:hypothetical protein